jgi:glycosyltransferase involved in cell wall biosynthesis
VQRLGRCDGDRQLIDWTCPECGKAARVRTLPVNCSCRIDKHSVASLSEISSRQAICRMCSNHRDDRCSLVESGCKSALRRRTRSATGTCPLGKWKWSHRPRIGFITPTLNYGGAERWIATLASHLDPELYDIRGMAVMLENTVNVPVAEHVKVVDGRFAIEWLACRCDLLIAWGMYSLQMLTWEYVKFKGPVLYSLQGHCDYTLKIVSACNDQVTHYVPVSEDAVRSVPRGKPYTVIHNAVDTARLRSELSREEARDRIGLRPGEIALGYVGRLSSEKDCLSCVLTAKQLGKPYRPVLVGGGAYSHYQLERAEMIHPDFIHIPFTENIGDVYRALDVVFLTSPSEGFAHSLAEAWYCGIPTVATPVGGVVELEREHGPVTVKVPIDHHVNQLVAAACKALRPENQVVVDRAKMIVERRFTERCMARRWEKLIGRMLNAVK